jgi:hypothetical protein
MIRQGKSEMHPRRDRHSGTPQTRMSVAQCTTGIPACDWNSTNPGFKYQMQHTLAKQALPESACLSPTGRDWLVRARPQQTNPFSANTLPCCIWTLNPGTGMSVAQCGTGIPACDWNSTDRNVRGTRGIPQTRMSMAQGGTGIPACDSDPTDRNVRGTMWNRHSCL